MENATKALLIAAAVLIVILLIAVGVQILNSTGDVSGQAFNVAGAIGSGTSDATESATQELDKLSGAKLIQFTIDGRTYKAKEGMTWGEWVASSYNTGSFEVGRGGDIRSPNPAKPVVWDQNDACRIWRSDRITPGSTYVLREPPM